MKMSSYISISSIAYYSVGSVVSKINPLFFIKIHHPISFPCFEGCVAYIENVCDVVDDECSPPSITHGIRVDDKHNDELHFDFFEND